MQDVWTGHQLINYRNLMSLRKFCSSKNWWEMEIKRYKPKVLQERCKTWVKPIKLVLIGSKISLIQLLVQRLKNYRKKAWKKNQKPWTLEKRDSNQNVIWCKWDNKVMLLNAQWKKIMMISKNRNRWWGGKLIRDPSKKWKKQNNIHKQPILV